MLRAVRQAIANHSIAVIDFAESAAFDAYLIPAHVADFNALIDPLTYKAPNSFSIFAGALAGDIGFATLGRPAGCKKIAQMTEYAPPAVRAQQEAGFASAAKAAGMQVANPVYPITGTPDMSPFAQDAVSEGADCVALRGEGADEVSLIKALHGADPKMKIITSVSFLSGSEGALGSLMSKLVIQALAEPATSTSIPAVRQWVSDIKKYSPQPKTLDSNSAILWAYVQLVTYAARHVSNPTAANIENFLNHLSDYNPGVEPPVSFTKPYPTSLGTRIFSPTQRLVTYKNGAYYSRGPFRTCSTGAFGMAERTVVASACWRLYGDAKC